MDAQPPLTTRQSGFLSAKIRSYYQAPPNPRPLSDIGAEKTVLDDPALLDFTNSLQDFNLTHISATELLNETHNSAKNGFSKSRVEHSPFQTANLHKPSLHRHRASMLIPASVAPRNHNVKLAAQTEDFIEERSS